MNNHLQAGDDDYSGTYDFTIKDGILSSSEPINISESVDEKILIDVQEIIDQYELVKRNGKDEYTSGLPYEHQPCYLKVVYESGEVLYFSEDNDPKAYWPKDLFVLFRQYFIEKGHEELKPSKEAGTIIRFDIKFNENVVAYQYCEMIDTDGIKKLYKDEYNLETKDGQDYLVDIPEDFYDRLFELIDASNMSKFHTGSMVASSSDCPRTKDGYFEIYIDYENGNQIYGYSKDKEKVEEFKKEIVPVKEYLDNIFK